MEVAEPDHLVAGSGSVEPNHCVDSRVAWLPASTTATLEAEPALVIVDEPIEVVSRNGEVMDPANHCAAIRAARTAAAISALRGLRRSVSPPFTWSTCPVMKQ